MNDLWLALPLRGNMPVPSVNRRDFLGLALLAALDAAIDHPALLAESTDSSRQAFAAFQELSPVSIKVQGWLSAYLHKQAASLAYALPEVSWPWSAPYWQGEEEAPSWWPWEQVAYWIDGATRCALITGDEALLKRVLERIRYTLAHQDGSYIGPKYMRDGTTSYNRWPHSIFFRALTVLSDDGALPNIPELLSSFYLSFPDGYDLPARNAMNVETMLWCYGRTGNPKLLELAERSWQGYVTGKPHDAADLSIQAVYEGGPINAHGVTYAEMAKLPAILYAHSGKEEYLRFALAAQKRIFDHHMLVDGIPSTTEHFRTTTALDSHETCDITDHTWTWGYLLSATGDGVWGDRIERACFNAGMGAIRKDWKALQYFSCPNQVLATETSNHNILKRGNYWMAYQPNPGRGTACCGANVHRLFPNYALRMWMTAPPGGLVATLYGASTVEACVGDDQTPISVEQLTAYPFGDLVRFTIQLPKPVNFPLKLRVPAWCSAPDLKINDRAITMPPVEKGFVTLVRRFNPGDVIVLHLPMTVHAISTIDRGVAYECGPLVYSYPLPADWTSRVIPRWTDASYPAWDARTTKTWNFGVPDQPTPVLVRTALTDDPWISPPCTLSLQANELPAWTLAPPVTPKADPQSDATLDPLMPALPEDRKVTSPVQTITLVPYGATELRVTIFPKISS